MHKNSLTAIKAITQDGSRLSRREIILKVFEDNPESHFTDREVLKILYPWSDNLNLVRPRLTELVKDNKLEEWNSARCSVTGKTVRLVRLAKKEKQTSLF